LYTGKRLEAETGLVDYGYRDYAPRLARFTTVDPIRDGRNWYAYVGGDPVNRVDLWGLEATDGPSATYRALVGASLALGPAVAAEIGYVTDTEGGFGIAMTVAGGTGVQGSIDVGLSTIISIILEVAGGTALSFPETIEGTVADLAGPVQFAEAGFIVGIQVDLEESELSGYTIGLSAGGGAYWGYRFVIEF
ncbi:MAG: RHS repeat-associated core domain-containing protein, partial [Spirochaetaceae bacterium]|nr:RHS repeat-associated core domain-containing protein [Spirochaetaceae bacterium]